MVSQTLFNKQTGMAMACPIANTFRNFPFHVGVPPKAPLTGYIMVEQLKSIDYASRKAKFVAKARARCSMKCSGFSMRACTIRGESGK